jgi:uncharacterized protein (TIGR04255 family)
MKNDKVVELKSDPLVEVIWQLQFDPPPNQSVGDALLGALFVELRKNKPNLTVQRLPAADLPSQIAQLDPNVRFAVKFRMEDPDGPYLFQVGDRVVTLNCKKPYSGWSSFKKEILAFIKVLEKSMMIGNPARHSIRYINLFESDADPDISPLNVRLSIGKHKIKKSVNIKTNIDEGGAVSHAIIIASPVELRLSEGKGQGAIADLETINKHNPRDWGDVLSQIDLLHDGAKKLFFEQILTKVTVNKLKKGN